SRLGRRSDRGRVGRERRPWVVEQRALRRDGGGGRRGGRRRGGRGGRERGREAVDQRAELELAQQHDRAIAVVVVEPGRLDVELDRGVVDDPGQPFAEPQRVGV